MVDLVKGKTFGVEPVIIDDQFFYECVFNETSLVYTGGELPSFEKCTFNSASFSFKGAAGNTLTFMKVLYHVGFKESIEMTFADIKAAPPADAVIENNNID